MLKSSTDLIVLKSIVVSVLSSFTIVTDGIFVRPLFNETSNSAPVRLLFVALSTLFKFKEYVPFGVIAFSTFIFNLYVELSLSSVIVVFGSSSVKSSNNLLVPSSYNALARSELTLYPSLVFSLNILISILYFSKSCPAGAFVSLIIQYENGAVLSFTIIFCSFLKSATVLISLVLIVLIVPSLFNTLTLSVSFCVDIEL